MTTPSVSTTIFLEELFHHPYWKDQGSLEERPVVLIEDAQNQPLCFQLRWQLKDRIIFLAPFWIDLSLQKWCFRNGHPHTFQSLSDMILEILHHLEKGEVLLHKNKSSS